MSKSKDVQELHKMLARLEQQHAAEVAPKPAPNPARAAKRLNAQHERFGAGFYPTAVKFNDHNGRPIFL
ncbi:hypothetical protein [Shigella flexneri]|uniref:hypothetical protein n=1 Tax=Shigella flexneri TaxID=623 RepID=UPI003CEA3EE8|nr:hypothetical protein [Escherichia coli]